MAASIAELSGTDLPMVRADWFIATAARPPLYHTLLRLPETAGELESQLNVDVRSNFLRNQLARAGFATSGISGQNRLIERHEADYGAYWKSYDFKAGTQQSNLFQFPLGPLFDDHPYPDLAFVHAGGEIIFHLPNGLQGYMLVDGEDGRIDEGPIDVVSDKLKTSGTPTIVNGLSCMACHVHGIIREFGDSVRQGTAVRGEPLQAVRRLYSEAAAMDKFLDADDARFLPALDRAIGPFLRDEGDQSDIRLFAEPIGPIARWYRLQDLGPAEVAAELGVEPARLLTAIDLNPRLRDLGLAPLLGGAPIKREAWESREFGTSPFQEAARELRLGTPVVYTLRD
jgi:serine/threonine-protein kinase